MKGSKKVIKTITIAAAVLVFGIGVIFAVKTSGSANSTNVDVTNTQVAANNAVEIETMVQTEPAKETETEETESAAEAVTETSAVTEEKETQAVSEAVTQTEQNTEAVKEAATEPETEEQKEADTDKTSAQPSTVDSRVYAVIDGINSERSAAGASAVSYDATLTAMAQERASENADNDFFVIENGKHKRPDGSNASTICTEYGQYGNFGEVMGRYQASASEIVAGWHNSATHYSCMTNAKYTRVGVGVAADSNGDLYWVAIFMN